MSSIHSTDSSASSTGIDSIASASASSFASGISDLFSPPKGLRITYEHVSFAYPTTTAPPSASASASGSVGANNVLEGSASASGTSSNADGAVAASRAAGGLAAADEPFSSPRSVSSDASTASAGRPILDDVSFDVPPGKTIAIVGPSGGGKSTTMRLLLRFFDPTEGSIRIDGRDIRSIDVRELRRMVGMVDQETTLLDRTLTENIMFGSEDLFAAGTGTGIGTTSASGTDQHGTRVDRDAARAGLDERVIAAAKLAHAHDFIAAMPDGYNTRVGQSGSRLSGGQRQRVLLARAIFRATPILLLDEYSSALDAESEALVNEALGSLMGGQRTSFVIAHRLATAMRADEIFVMEGGRIVERGSHAELLATRPNGLYARLVRHQQLVKPSADGASASASASSHGGSASRRGR